MRNQFYAKSILWLLLLVSINGFSQDKPKMIWSEPNEGLKGYEVNDLFGFSDDFFFVFKENKRKKYRYALQKVTTDSLKIVGERIFNFPEVEGDEPRLITSMSIGEKQYLLAYTSEKKKDEVNIFAFEILDTPNISSKPTLLAKANKLALNTERVITAFKDEKNELFTIILPLETQPEKNEKFQLLLFNSELTKVKSKEIEVPYPADILEYTEALVDSSGSIYVLATIINQSLTSINKDRNIGKNYSLFKYSWETETLIEKSLSLGSKWLYDVRLFLNANNNVQVAGYYSNMLDLIMAGTFSLEINKETGEVLNQGLNPFDREFRSQFRPKGGIITDIELGMYKLDYVFPQSNGMTLFISEKNYTETSTVFNPGTGTYSIITVYNYDEIMLSSISPSSKIEFNLIIPKYQSSTSSYDDYTSYLSFSDGDKTFVVYNDHDRNEKISLTQDKGYRQLTSPSNTATMLVVIHQNGQMKKLPLYTSSKEKPVLNPNFFYQTRDGVVLLTQSGFDTRFLKLKLK